MHMVSKKDLNKTELETVRISKIPIMVVTASGEVQTKEAATVYVRELDLFVTVKLLEDAQQFFHSENSAKITGIHTIGPVVKNHISPKMARKWIAIFQTICHSLSLVYRRVPLLQLHLLLQHLHRGILWSARKIQQQKEVRL